MLWTPLFAAVAQELAYAAVWQKKKKWLLKIITYVFSIFSLVLNIGQYLDEEDRFHPRQ